MRRTPTTLRSQWTSSPYRQSTARGNAHRLPRRHRRCHCGAGLAATPPTCCGLAAPRTQTSVRTLLRGRKARTASPLYVEREPSARPLRLPWSPQGPHLGPKSRMQPPHYRSTLGNRDGTLVLSVGPTGQSSEEDASSAVQRLVSSKNTPCRKSDRKQSLFRQGHRTEARPPKSLLQLSTTEVEPRVGSNHGLSTGKPCKQCSL